jgi:hypothetical protein
MARKNVHEGKIITVQPLRKEEMQVRTDGANEALGAWLTEYTIHSPAMLKTWVSALSLMVYTVLFSRD